MLRAGREGDAAQGFLDVLAVDPTFGLALRNVRVAARNAVSHIFRVFAVVTSVTGYALIILLISSPLDRGALDVLHGCLAFVAAVSAAIVISYLWRLRSRVGRRFFAYLRRMPRTDPSSTAFAALFLVVFALMTAACFESVAVSSALYAGCWILLIASRAIPRRSIAHP
jgi:hypothetical protein